MEKCIFDILEDALGWYLAEEISQYLKGDAKSAEAIHRMEEIKKQYERISSFFDYDRPASLSEEECRALIEYLRCKFTVDNKELEISYALGFRHGIAFMCKYDTVKTGKEDKVC